MLFINADQDNTQPIDQYGLRAKGLVKLYRGGIPTPKSFALSMNEFWGDQELIEAVERIGGFPVTLSLGASSSINYFVDFHSFENDRDLKVAGLNELKAEIRGLTDIYAKQSSSLSRQDKGAFSLIIQKKIDFEYQGTAYSLDPYLGNEELFFLEIFGRRSPALQETHDSIPHQYSINYFSRKVVSSEVGTGHVDLTADLVKKFAQTLLSIQEIMEAPQKVRFGVDRSGKLWITHLKTMTPILFGAENDRYFGMDYLDPNSGFDVYTPLMYGLIESGFDRALRRLFQNYHPRKEIMIQRFGRTYLCVSAIRDLLKNFPPTYLPCVLRALEIDVEHEVEEERSTSWKAHFREWRIRVKQEALFARYQDYFEKYKIDFEMNDLKYRAYRQNISSQPHRKLESSFSTLLEDYYFPTLSLHYCFCLLEISIRSELIDCLQSLGIDKIIDKDFLSGIGENPNATLQNRLSVLFDVFKDKGITSDQYLDERKNFINGHYYYGMSSRDLFFPRWGDDIEELEQFFAHLSNQPEGIRVVDESSTAPSYSQYLHSKLYSLHPLKRSWVKRRLDRIIANFRQVYSARRQLHDQSLRSLYIVRSYVQQLAMNYADLGVLESPDQIFFLKLQELLSIPKNAEEERSAEWFEKINIRKQLYCGAKSFIPPRQFGKKDVSSLTPKSNNSLKGFPASEGEIKGKVVILHDHMDLLRLRSDSILVASEVESGLAFLAGVVQGVVLEYGNSMSQLASLCRKNKIPLIIRANGITKSLRDGDQVLINGRTGEVTLLNFTSN